MIKSLNVLQVYAECPASHTTMRIFPGLILSAFTLFVHISDLSAQNKPAGFATETIIFLDDFSKDAVGDFPAKWNTNSSGTITKIDGQQGLWLSVPDNAISFPELKNALPPNFVIEFDLYYPVGVTRPPVTFGFSEVKNPAKEAIRYKKIFYFRIPPTGNENIGYSTSLYSGKEITREWPSQQKAGKVVHVNITVNGQRIRLNLDDEKMFDLPKAFEPESLRTNFHFRSAELLPRPKDGFYIADLSIRQTGLDARSQLLKDGRFSTTGIYFKSGSADLEPASAVILKDIADALKDNAAMKLAITGHTDNEGNPAANLTLSEKRAAAVKDYLVKKFSVEDSRLKTNGKGDTAPAGSNATPEGKAQNRRVEFVVVTN